MVEAESGPTRRLCGCNAGLRLADADAGADADADVLLVMLFFSQLPGFDDLAQVSKAVAR